MGIGDGVLVGPLTNPGASEVTSFNTRTGAVTSQSGDYTAAQVGALPSTDDLSAIATANPTAAAVAMNTKKITGLANGSASSDAAAFGQIPTTLPPNGSAGGDLSGTYPNPTVAKVQGTAVSSSAPSTNQGLVFNGALWLPSALVNSFNTRTGAVFLTKADVEAVFAAKGGILVGTGAGTGEELATGTSGQVLTVGGADPSGLEWATPGGGGGGNPILAAVQYPTTNDTYHSASIDFSYTYTPVDHTNMVATFTTPSSGAGSSLVLVKFNLAIVDLTGGGSQPIPIYYCFTDPTGATIYGKTQCLFLINDDNISSKLYLTSAEQLVPVSASTTYHMCPALTARAVANVDWTVGCGSASLSDYPNPQPPFTMTVTGIS